VTVPNYTFGLDLGQVRDHSALIVAERVQAFVGQSAEEGFGAGYRLEDTYHVRGIQRWELGTPYEAVVESVAELYAQPGLEDAQLVLDRTGVGGAVADMFRQAYRRGELGRHWPLPVSITAGFSLRGSARGYGESTVHKGDLVQRLYMLLEGHRVHVPLGLPLAEGLTKEVRAFRPKQSPRTGNLSFEAEHESDHDDLVIALALAVWWPHTKSEPRYVDRSGQLQEKPWAIATHPD
jgi:hypothetical protein